MDSSFRTRIAVWHAAMVIGFPVVALALAINWLLNGTSARESYWAWRPRPKVGLRELSPEEKWPYLRKLEAEVETLKARLASPEEALRKGLEEAVGKLNFDMFAMPILEGFVKPLKNQAARLAGAMEAANEVHLRVASRERPIPETGISVEEPVSAGVPVAARIKVSPAAVGDAVAKAVEQFAELNGELVAEDPDLAAALQRLRAGDLKEPE